MAPRSVPEWIADHPDQAIPRLVKARVWAAANGCCAKTGRKLRAGDAHQFDHIKPLIDGGEHRESNLQLLSVDAHKEKTAEEAGARAKERRIHAKHHGYWPKTRTPLKGRGFEKSRRFSPSDHMERSR